MEELLPEYRGFLKEGGAMEISSEGTVGYLKRFNPKVRCIYRKGRFYAVLDMPKSDKRGDELISLLKKGIFEMDLHRVNGFLHPYNGLALSVYTSKRKDICSKTVYSALFKRNRQHQKALVSILKNYIDRFDFDYLILRPGMDSEIAKALKNKYPVFERIRYQPVEEKKWLADAIRIHQGMEILFPELLRGKRILIVDDIMGTGAHLFSLSVKLWESSVKRIYAIALGVKNPKEKVWYDWDFERREKATIKVDIGKILSSEKYIHVLSEFRLPDIVLAEAIVRREFNAGIHKGKGGYYAAILPEEKEAFADRFL